MEISFTPAFIKQLKSLPEKLQEEALEKIEMFSDIKNHQTLKVHKLKGRLNGRQSFSVNFSTRIVFCYLKTKPKEACLLAIGDHEVYDK
jgi:mRNA-degrading endonuclease YafQ of YafQ-DinJ toxin-antitoxin module